MLIHFLVEDQSGGKLIEEIMKKYKFEYSFADIRYDIYPYHGIGRLKKGSDAKANKSQLLLNELPKRISAYNSFHQCDNKEKAVVFIIVDNDKRNTDDFLKELNDSVKDKKITIDRAFCVAVEEMEAWLLGDVSAIINAYPDLKDRVMQRIHNYKQDEIREDGTWEFLLDMLTPKNKKKHDLDNVGKLKSEWAEKIGIYMNIRGNESPSFNYFISELDKRLN